MRLVVNVLWLMADELRADALGCYGNPQPRVTTPNIDALAASGVRFDRAYAASPICLPSRAAMLTGVSPLTSGILGNEGYATLGTPPTTFLEIAAASGWTTTNCGKEHLPPGWSPWQHSDEAGSRMDALLSDAEKAGAEIRRSPGLGHVYAATLPADSSFTGGLVTDRTEAAIRAAGTSKAPFVIRASYLQPHKPMVVPEPWASRYADVDLTVDTETHDSISRFEREFGSINRGVELDPAELRLGHQLYLGAVAWLDDQVGRLVAALRNSGLLESTAVLMTTDHGAHVGEGGAFGKHTFAPRSHRVPLIVRRPGEPVPGAVRSDLAIGEDLAPTVLGLLGLSAPSGLDGRDLFADPAPERIISAIGYGEASSRAFPHRDRGRWGQRGWPQRVCVRTDRYRLDLNTRIDGGPVDPEDEDVFLADLRRGPEEVVNVAGDPTYRDVLAELLGHARRAASSIPRHRIDEAGFAGRRTGMEPV